MKIKLLLTATLACMTYFTADAENFFATLLGKTDKEVEARLDKVWNRGGYCRLGHRSGQRMAVSCRGPAGRRCCVSVGVCAVRFSARYSGDACRILARAGSRHGCCRGISQVCSSFAVVDCRCLAGSGFIHNSEFLYGCGRMDSRVFSAECKRCPLSRGGCRYSRCSP